MAKQAVTARPRDPGGTLQQEARRVPMTIQLDVIQTVGLAVLVFLLGRFIKSKVGFFQKYFIPAPVSIMSICDCDSTQFPSQDIPDLFITGVGSLIIRVSIKYRYISRL